MMNINFEQGRLYVDNIKFCFYEVTNGSKNLPTGRITVEARYSHAHSKTLPFVDSVGWVGASSDCAIVLGKVLGRNSPIPDANAVQRLVAAIEAADEAGLAVIAEFKHG